MAVTKEFIVHQEPIWRDRANFIINAALPETDRPHRFEQLWARQLEGNKFEVCCIPFFLYNIALGDIVLTVARGELKYVVDQMIRHAGHYTFRVWFDPSFHSRDEITSTLMNMGALLERSSTNLLAVDAPDLHHAKAVANFLAEREQRGQLMYETGQTS
jgi:hypothetical protein